MSRQVLTRQASRSRLVLEQSVLPQLPSADWQVGVRVRERKREMGGVFYREEGAQDT